MVLCTKCDIETVPTGKLRNETKCPSCNLHYLSFSGLGAMAGLLEVVDKSQDQPPIIAPK